MADILAGDVLYIPDWWWHATCNTADFLGTVAVGGRGDSSSFPGHFHAVIDGDISALKKLGRKVARAVDSEGDTALHLAALGPPAAVEALLTRRAKVDAANQARITPLHVAVQNGHLSNSRLLLENRADVNKQQSDLKTALYFASEVGHVGLSSYLVSQRAEIQPDAWHPLHAACRMGHAEIVELLLSSGASVSATTPEGGDSFQPLHQAAKHGATHAAKVLLAAKASVDAVDAKGREPLHLAAAGAHLDVLKLLLANRASVDARDARGATPLHWAAFKGHLVVFQSLVEDFAADTALPMSDSTTPAQVAQQSGHRALASYLSATSRPFE